MVFSESPVTICSCYIYVENEMFMGGDTNENFVSANSKCTDVSNKIFEM